MPSASDPSAEPPDLYAGQPPDQEPSLAARNNGGAAPSSEPAPAGRREALLVLSFGGPEGHDDVLEFIEQVRQEDALRAERAHELLGKLTAQRGGGIG